MSSICLVGHTEGMYCTKCRGHKQEREGLGSADAHRQPPGERAPVLVMHAHSLCNAWTLPL
eukprot:scaffold147314_cov19-Tisochrysis_lutea.AAC.1